MDSINFAKNNNNLLIYHVYPQGIDIFLDLLIHSRIFQLLNSRANITSN
jgi:hypothetical protein